MVKSTETLIILAACVALSGCAGSLPGSGNTDVIGVLREIATDPNRGHTDRVSGNLGGLTGNNLNVFLERTCPARVVPLSEFGKPES